MTHFTLNRQALKITIGYIVLSALWILFSDRLLLTNPATELYISTMKGWAYTIVVGILLYLFIAGALNKIAAEEVEHKKVWDALHKSEERLKLTLDATGIGTWDWNLVQDVYYASSRYFTMLGYPPEDGPVDRAIWVERFHPDDKGTVNTKIKDVLSGKETRYEYEARIMHADGSYRWIHTIGFVIERDKQGKATRMLGVRMDITNRKEAEETLEKKVKELERLNGFMVNRELRMAELKNEIEELKKQTKG